MGLLVTLVVGGLAGAEPPAAPGRSASPDVAGLVSALQAADPVERRAAEQELRRLGPAVLPELAAVSPRMSLETRLTAVRLADQIRRDETDRRLTAFLDGRLDGAEMAGWTKFAAIAGDTSASRRWYVRLRDRHDELIESVDQSTDQPRATLYASLADEVVTGSLQQQPVRPETIGALLFVGTTVVEPHTDLARMSRLQYAFQPDRLGKLLVPGTGDPTLRKLASAWTEHIIVGNFDRHQAQFVLQIAIGLELRETVRSVARAALALPTYTGPFLETYMLYLGRFGTAEDLPLLRRYLDDSRTIQTFYNAAREDYLTLEVRDVALAVTIHLSGEDPKAFGYDGLVLFEPTLYSSHSLGFDRADRRAQARAKWDAFVAEKNGASPANDPDGASDADPPADADESADVGPGDAPAP